MKTVRSEAVGTSLNASNSPSVEAMFSRAPLRSLSSRRPCFPAKPAPEPMRWRDKKRPALLLLLLLLLQGFVLGGCQHVIEPPAAVSDPVRVFVIDYGRHASLALPKEDSGLVEWSWGDWNWFALDRTGPLDGLQALFASPRSTLGRRELAPAQDAEELAARLGAQQLLSLNVERERARALQRHLDARWLRRRHEAVAHPGGTIFVPDDRRYGLFNNSVHELARWLEALGANVSGTGVTAKFKLSRPRSAPRRH